MVDFNWITEICVSIKDFILSFSPIITIVVTSAFTIWEHRKSLTSKREDSINEKSLQIYISLMNKIEENTICAKEVIDCLFEVIAKDNNDLCINPEIYWKMKQIKALNQISDLPVYLRQRALKKRKKLYSLLKTNIENEINRLRKVLGYPRVTWYTTLCLKYDVHTARFLSLLAIFVSVSMAVIWIYLYYALLTIGYELFALSILLGPIAIVIVGMSIIWFVTSHCPLFLSYWIRKYNKKGTSGKDSGNSKHKVKNKQRL